MLYYNYFNKIFKKWSFQTPYKKQLNHCARQNCTLERLSTFAYKPLFHFSPTHALTWKLAPAGLIRTGARCRFSFTESNNFIRLWCSGPALEFIGKLTCLVGNYAQSSRCWKRKLKIRTGFKVTQKLPFNDFSIEWPFPIGNCSLAHFNKRQEGSIKSSPIDQFRIT